METSLVDTNFDFIVVGSGPAGAVVARRLADTAKAPSVLLLEAGSSNADPVSKLIADRFNIFYNFPNYNWGYKSVSQSQLDGRCLDLSRGKGLGGTSSINFSFWTTGPSEDYNEWALRVGDESFNWQNTARRFKAIESYTPIENATISEVVSPSQGHGFKGALNIEFPVQLDSPLPSIMKAALDLGYKWNNDMNSGDPIGIGLLASGARNGTRMTSSDAYLFDTPRNLTIKTNSTVTKVIFDRSRAVGTVTAQGTYWAQKEVILCCGTIDTPKLLQLSGVGSAVELSKHGIESVVDLPFIGKNMEDHVMVMQSVELKDDIDPKQTWLRNPDKMAEVKAQFLKDGTGPARDFYGTITMGWNKVDPTFYETETFKALPQATQRHIKHPTVPTSELAFGAPNFDPAADPTKSYLTLVTFLMNGQSRGTVTLQSANPEDAPLIDPQYLTKDYDRAILISAMRDSYKLLTHPIIAENTKSVTGVPSGLTDEEIWSYIKLASSSVYHMSSTVKMGRKDDTECPLTSDFRVKGTKGLRVADMSVAPFCPNTHTQSVAYLIGEIAAEKLIKEYNLDA